jgi:oligopeptide transport system ATP-binding protein
MTQPDPAPAPATNAPPPSAEPDPAISATGEPIGRPLVEIDRLKTYYPIRAGILRRVVGHVRAVDDVSFEIRKGEVFGLVGESGCGKTTLGRTLLRLENATAGKARLDGGDVLSARGDSLRKLRRRMQIIFQDPVGSLNPRMPVSDIIGEGLLAQADAQNRWAERKVRDRRVGDYLEVVGLRRDYDRRYPHEFSGGQRQRIGIARALALAPEFIFADEPVSALDVSIQSQILNLLIDLRQQFGLTYLFVAHNLAVVGYISDRIAVMYLGKIVELGPAHDLFANPQHPYTMALLSAIPQPVPGQTRDRVILKGDVPSPIAPPSGCRFRTRCPIAQPICAEQEPPLVAKRPSHLAACHFAGTPLVPSP